MARAIKIFLIVIAALVVLLAATVFVVTQVIDPNDFKPQIREQAMTQANLDLEIPGDLAWQFWPSLGVSLGRTEARIAGEEELFAGINSASVGVAVWPLLFGQVEMDGVTLDGLEVNLVETADGANWEKIGPQRRGGDRPRRGRAARRERRHGHPADHSQRRHHRRQIRYRNTTDGTDIRVEHFNFNAQDVSLEEPFPMQMSLRYQDQSDMRVDLNWTPPWPPTRQQPLRARSDDPGRGHRRHDHQPGERAPGAEAGREPGRGPRPDHRPAAGSGRHPHHR